MWFMSPQPERALKIVNIACETSPRVFLTHCPLYFLLSVLELGGLRRRRRIHAVPRQLETLTSVR